MKKTNYPLNENYRVSLDTYSLLLQKRKFNKKKKEHYWVPEGYYPTLESLISALVTKSIIDEEMTVTGFQMLLNELKENMKKFVGELPPYRRGYKSDNIEE